MCVCVLNLASLNKIFQVCIGVCPVRQIPEKGARYAYLMQIDAAENASRMCLCMDFLSRAPKCVLLRSDNDDSDIRGKGG